MGVYHRGTYNPHIDDPGNMPPEKAPRTLVTWLLAGAALLSLLWAAASFSLREERASRPTARPSAQRPLFADTPASVQREEMPASEVSLAAAVRRAEKRGGEELWRSHETMGVHPTPSQKSASDSLKRHVPPGREIHGWVMQVHWSILRDRGGSSKYSYTGVPAVYELTLRFPENLAGYEVWLWGHNYDFRSKEFTCPNRRFEAIEDGDWVRVFGALRSGSRIEWEPTQTGELISLGEMTISDIQSIEVDQE